MLCCVVLKVNVFIVGHPSITVSVYFMAPTYYTTRISWCIVEIEKEYQQLDLLIYIYFSIIATRFMELRVPIIHYLVFYWRLTLKKNAKVKGSLKQHYYFTTQGFKSFTMYDFIISVMYIKTNVYRMCPQSYMYT